MVRAIDKRLFPSGRAAAVAAALTLALFPRPAVAWLFFEHRAISAQGIEAPDPEHRILLDAIWSEAREGYAKRLCSQPSEKIEADHPACVDLAAWPAIGGDHSCAPRDMLASILESDWILPVIGAAEKTG